MKTSELDYALPEALIAQAPAERRDHSRLLVLHRDSGKLEHRIFYELSEYLRAGDLLVANESRVIPARLYGRKEPTGGKVEVLLLHHLEDQQWRCLVGGARTRVGTKVRITQGENASSLTAEVVAMGERGERVLSFSEPVEPYLETVGNVPLPPYIHRPLDDPERYQTIYSHTPGSAAAPTAGLHFTPELMLRLRDEGVRFAFVTLHVGLDTFRPITEETVDTHQIHTEWCTLSPKVAEDINQTKLSGGRVIAVGTTSVRVLETATQSGLHPASERTGSKQLQKARPERSQRTCPWRTVSAFEGFTDLYITPGFNFRVVDAMITNFHLPKSTLLALVMAFAGEENIRHAYAEAIAQRYRFFSLGDAMLIV